MIRNIQFLRFIAAAMVVFAHYPLAAVTICDANPSLLKLGGFGVDIFFVISGFIMLLILYPTACSDIDRPSMTWLDFIRRRIYRVWPLYFIMTVIAVFISSLVADSILVSDVEISRAYNASKLDMGLFIESITFSHAFIAPVLDVGWTLQFEFAFYIAIALLMAFGVRKCDTLIFSFASLLMLSALCMAPLTKYGVLGGSAIFRPLMILSNPMMMEFLLGMLLYRMIRSGVLLGKRSSILFFAVTIPAFLAAEFSDFFSGFGGAYHRAFVWGVFAFMVVWAAISMEKYIRIPPRLGVLGDSSCSLYLVHWLLLPWISLFMTESGVINNINLLALLAVNIIVCQAAAIIVYKYLELPVGRLFKRVLVAPSQTNQPQT